MLQANLHNISKNDMSQMENCLVHVKDGFIERLIVNDIERLIVIDNILSTILIMY